MKCAALVISAMCFFALAALAGDEEIRCKSPDGQFALSVSPEQTSIVRLPSREPAIEVDDLGRPFLTGKKLIWSDDSRRVAYYGPDRRGGSLTVYFRKGDAFELVDMPEFPAPKFSAKNTDKCEIVGISIVRFGG